MDVLRQVIVDYMTEQKLRQLATIDENGPSIEIVNDERYY